MIRTEYNRTVRGDRGGYARALKHIRADYGLSRRKAKRKLLRMVAVIVSPGMQALSRKRQGYPWDGSMTEALGKQIAVREGKRPLTRNERRALNAAARVKVLDGRRTIKESAGEYTVTE